MPVTYKNRKGFLYYLHQGTTKTGKPRYFFSRDASGQLVDAIPPGCEITESVNGIVSLRRKSPRVISDEEVQTVRAALARLPRLRGYQVDIKRYTILIYEPIGRLGPDLLAELYGKGPLPPALAERIREHNERYVQYTPVMRFTLVDPQERIFEVDRMCYRGGMEGWLSLHDSGDLPALVKRYVSHLGQESFFELY